MNTPTRRSFLTSGVALTAAAFVPVRAAAQDAQADKPFGWREPLPDSAAFLAAVRRGDTTFVLRALAERPELARCGDEHGRSPLVVAYLSGRQELARALVTRGLVELDFAESCMAGEWERAEALWKERPERLDAPHAVGGTAMYAAARAGDDGFWRLQSWGADTEARPYGVTPAYGALECEAWNDAVRTSCGLLANAADVNSPQRDGDSLLHVAARRGDAYLVRFVLRKGADVSARDDAGRTALDVARASGNESVATLLERHADVTRDDMSARYAYDASGAPVEWPDMSAFDRDRQGAVTGPSHFDLDAVREAVGDDPRLSFSMSSQDELAVEACGHLGRRDIMRFHLDNGVPQSVCTSVSIGDLARAKELLAESPTRVHERGPHDFAPMWYSAISGGSVEAAELLLSFGCDVDQESMGTTALHWAAMRDQLDLIRFLVEKGADAHVVGYKFEREGQTPLELAEARGKDKAAKLLRELAA